MSWVEEEIARDRLPVALLTGFLGSGKTTLLNRILGDPRLAETAVAINEFGEMALDQHFIDHGEDKTVVMANGCLCCTVSGDLDDAVMRIFTRRQSGELPQFKRLIIETSGLADPAPILQALLNNPVMSRLFRIDTLVTTVDGVFGRRQLSDNDEAVKQVALADRLVLTKPDIADPGEHEALHEALRRVNPTAPMVTARDGETDVAALFSPLFFDPAVDFPAVADLLAQHAAGAAHDHPHDAAPAPHYAGSIATLCLTAEAPLDWNSFRAWLHRIKIRRADNLLRVKGILNIAGEPRPIVVQGVHHVFHDPVALKRWPDEDRRSRLVFITRDLPSDELRRSWDELNRPAAA
ncbi:MAG: ATP-binding protein [Rhodospirillales bacterium]|jgi:G3E family GTPase|nr:ATP-binding protein [Rhodospirillales bacterium]